MKKHPIIIRHAKSSFNLLINQYKSHSRVYRNQDILIFLTFIQTLIAKNKDANKSEIHFLQCKIMIFKFSHKVDELLLLNVNLSKII